MPCQMRRPVFFCLLLLILIAAGSCFTPRKVDKYIADKYVSTPPSNKRKIEGITVNSLLSPLGDTLSSSYGDRRKFLPLIFYYNEEKTIHSSLNPQVPVNNFINTIITYSNKALKPKLNGKRIELTIEKVPSHFATTIRSQTIWLIYSYTWVNAGILPEDNELRVSYKLYENNSLAKSSVVSANLTTQGVNFGLYASIRKKIGEYLNKYDENITEMSKSIVDKIAAEL